MSDRTTEPDHDGGQDLPEARQAAAVARLVKAGRVYAAASEEIRQAVVAARAAGVTGRRVAELAPVAYSTVENWWKAARAEKKSED